MVAPRGERGDKGARHRLLLNNHGRRQRAGGRAVVQGRLAESKKGRERAGQKGMGRTLLIAWSGTGFMLSSLPFWVQPMAVALSVKQLGELPIEAGATP